MDYLGYLGFEQSTNLIDYKIMNLIKKIIFCLAFYLVVCTKVYANIIYEKDDILTDLEVEVFINFY